MPESTHQHQLLPWYATGVLDAREADEFRVHLDSCEACRDELELMEAIRAEAKSHGPAFFEDHPSPDRLVSALAGELSDDEAAEVHRHVALCADCSLEARWARGEGRAGRAAAAPPRRARWAWAAAVAASVLLAFVAGQRMGIDSDSGGVVRSLHVPAAERGTNGPVAITTRPDDTSVLLVFDLALPESSFPLTVEFTDESGTVIGRHDRIGPDTLQDSTYLYLNCDLRVFRPGTYAVRILGQDSAIPDIRRFEIR